MNPKSLIAATLTVFATACGAIGDFTREAPPKIDAPVLQELSTSATSGVVDPFRAELTWYDPTRARVVRFRDGRVEDVQDVAVPEGPEAPEALRVFDDGSFVLVVDGDLHLYPLGGERQVIDLPTLEFAGLDGASIDDFWFGLWSLEKLPGAAGSGDDFGYGACHVSRGAAGARATDRCVPVPNLGGYTGRLAVATDRSVYMTDRDTGLYRIVDGAVSKIGEFEGGVTSLRRGGDTLLAITYRSGLHRVEGSSLVKLSDGFTYDAIASGGAVYFITFDSESVKADPSCKPQLFHGCEYRTLWSQLALWRASGGSTVAVGYENCTETDTARCEYTIGALGIDGADVVVSGAPFRRAAAR